MRFTIDHNIPQVKTAMQGMSSQVPFAMAVALNKTVDQGRVEVQLQMARSFDRPTPWVVNSVRTYRATKTNLVATVGFKDRNSSDFRGEDTWRTMIAPHALGVKRHFKQMEARLLKMGLIPAGYNAVPGEAAKLDGYGNMSQGQISQLLNVLGTYTEGGYNTAGNTKGRDRLAKGNVKKGIYGFEYFVSYGNIGRTNFTVKNGRAVKEQISKNHLLPGVYQRVSTPWGSSLKPILIFVKQVNYKIRLDFFGIVQKVVDRDFTSNFNEAFDQAVRTARPN